MRKKDRYHHIQAAVHILFASTGTAACLFPRWFPFLPGADVYSAQILVLFLFLGILQMVARQPNLTFLYFGATLLMSFHLKHSLRQNGMEYWRMFPYLSKSESDGWSPRFRLAHFQLDRETVPADLIGLVRQHQPDIISLQLAGSMKDLALLDSLQDTYPYRRHLRTGPHSESAILARYRMGFHDTLFVDSLPTFRNCFNIGGHDLCLMAVHAIPNATGKRPAPIQDHLVKLAREITLPHIPQIVFGNFHSAAWSDELGRFLRLTGLRSTRDGFLQEGFSLDTPTYHFLYSDQLRCDDFRVIHGQRQDGPTTLLGQFSFSKTARHANKPPR